MGFCTNRVGIGFAVGALIFSFTGIASAAPSVQKLCGEDWAAAKKAGTVPAGQAWPGFLSECRKRREAGGTTATPAPTPVAAPAPAATPAPVTAAAGTNLAEECKAEYEAGKKSGSVVKGTNYFKYLSECRKRRAGDTTSPAKTTTAATPAPAATAAAPAQNSTEACKAEYEAGKKSGSVARGTNYFKYLSECRKRSAGTVAPTPAATVAPQPTPAPTATAPAPAAPASVAAVPPAAPGAKKPLSAGQEAFVERERQCGAKWKTIKNTAALPPGITTWPKYLSYCNTRLKQNLPI